LTPAARARSRNHRKPGTGLRTGAGCRDHHNRSMLLEESGHAVAASRFTYAQGALVLWSRDAPDCLAVLADEGSGRVALANPKTAPYGMAAVEFLDAEGGWEAVSSLSRNWGRRNCRSQGACGRCRSLRTPPSSSRQCCSRTRRATAMRDDSSSIFAPMMRVRSSVVTVTAGRSECFAANVVVDSVGDAYDSDPDPDRHPHCVVVVADRNAVETCGTGCCRDANRIAAYRARLLAAHTSGSGRRDR